MPGRLNVEFIIKSVKIPKKAVWKERNGESSENGESEPRKDELLFCWFVV